MILNPIRLKVSPEPLWEVQEIMYRRLPVLLDARRPLPHQVRQRRASQKWQQKRSSQNLQNSLTKVIYSSDPSFFRRFTQKSQKNGRDQKQTFLSTVLDAACRRHHQSSACFIGFPPSILTVTASVIKVGSLLNTLYAFFP